MGYPAAGGADTLPFSSDGVTGVPSPTNRVGVSFRRRERHDPSAGPVINTVVDSLAEPGVSHIEMP